MPKKRFFFLLPLLLLAACAANLCLGPYGFGWPDSLPGGVETASYIFWQIRLPRLLMAVTAGAVLAEGGLVFQTLFRNPLAEPYLLGISGGSAVGYTAGTLAGLSLSASGIAAFAGGILSLAAVLLSSAGKGRHAVLLSGVMLNAFCGAALLCLVSFLAPERISAVLYWSMGDLGAADLSTALTWSLCILPCCILLCFCARPLDLLLLGEEAASSLGLATERARTLLLCAISLLVSLTVAAAGPLGFVGLIVPQAMRLLFGGRHAALLPAALLAGPLFLVLCDMAARGLLPHRELPIGVITALAGVPVFIFLLRRQP